MRKTDLSNAKVLFVDDEVNILKSLKRSLLHEKFTKKWAESGEKALQILSSNSDISIIVTDMKMPNMDGIELLKRVSQKFPNISRIALTGYYQVPTILAAINKGSIHQYLTKPIQVNEELIPALQRGYEHYLLKREREDLIEKLSRANEELKKRNKDTEKMRKNEETVKEHRTRIIYNIVQYITPFMEELIAQTDELKNFDDKKVSRAAKDLNENGKIIFQKIKTIESTIKNKI